MSHAELQADAVRVLTHWRPSDATQQALAHGYLAFLAARDDATQRSCTPGHLTASAVVLSADLRSTLLTLHPRVGRWLQLGGHCEDGDTTLAGAALREALEESGIVELMPVAGPIQLDVHPITCSSGVPTRHLDVRFTVIAAAGAQAVISDESDDLRWWPVDVLPERTDPLLAASVGLAIAAAVAAGHGSTVGAVRPRTGSSLTPHHEQPCRT